MATTYENYFLTLLATDSYNRGDFVNVVLPGGLTGPIGSAQLQGLLGEKLTAAQISAHLGENSLSLASAAAVGFNATAYDWDGQFKSVLSPAPASSPLSP